MNGAVGGDAVLKPAASKSVIVKLYDVDEGALSLNDAVEFVGILSIDPSLARFESSDENVAMEHDLVAQVLHLFCRARGAMV